MKDIIYRLLIFSILVLTNIPALGQVGVCVEPIFGVEWGGGTTMLETYHRNFVAEGGYRVDEKGMTSSFKATGSLVAKAGIRFWDHYSATLNTGIMGIRQERSGMPFSGRFSYHFSTYDQNGWMSFVEAGAIYLNKYYTNFLAETGAGYRMNLSHRFSLDFLLSVRACGDERNITDPDTGNDIDVWNIKKNNSTFFYACYKISLNF